MVVTDINMVRQLSTTINRRSLSSLPMLCATLTLLVDLANSSVSCGSGIKSVGGTVPSGDIILEYGNGVPLEITCILQSDTIIVQNLFHDRTDSSNKTKFPSHRIIFYKNAEIVPRQYVTIINATAAQLRIPNPPAGQDTYYCTLLLDYERNKNESYGNSKGNQPYIMPSNVSSTLSTVEDEVTDLNTNGSHLLGSQVGVCLNRVYVGYKPAIVKNFTCISENWVNLRCNWNISENPIKTTYTLLFRLPGRAGGRIFINCPTDSDIKENTCYWDFNTTPMYRQPYEFYDFRLNGQNVLGNSSTFFNFHHYANIIPASPINITVVDKTESSAMLRWSVGTMTNFPRELVYKIEYKSQWDFIPENWHSIITSDVECSMSNQTNLFLYTMNCQERNDDYYYYNVTDLKYPSAHYDFRMYVRSSLARGEDKWSSPGHITLKTKPSIPRRPPRTDIGSFESITSRIDKSKRNVFIYWQQIDDSEKCGDSFEYRAYYTSTTEQNKSIIHYSNEIYESYAKFQGLSTSVGYNFTVYSSNKEGLSKEFSTIYVPSESQRIEKPILLTKMVFHQQGVFELSWKNSGTTELSSADELNYYTLFWCENVNRDPYQCNGYMNWTHVPSSEFRCNVTILNYNVNNHYQFAISANSRRLLSNGTNSYHQSNCKSSGMVWESCTIQNNITARKVENVWVSVISSTFLGLRWNIDCTDRIGLVGEYQIFYCAVVSANNYICSGSMLSKTMSREEAQKDRGFTLLTNLEPNTTYIVSISISTNYDKGIHSDPLLITTLGLGGGWYLKQEYLTYIKQLMKHNCYP
ncbi:cytokine receptor-like isoform X1 [Acyrthosiphon pisum]|uniref:Fibronectin type-III domain-containing protein n=1 Tax=Acyrthosiphon pisum TaxID=7029 RepID=A0A8R2AYP0_ACYPI|nr:cytokine receptor-like isoform X1 [Acyrthosiphon pisum]|eukprot:XP_008178335.1 PREDICTED: cytokine receptor-like isoform X1 [Acyrthosiphon pisum]